MAKKKATETTETNEVLTVEEVETTIAETQEAPVTEATDEVAEASESEAPETTEAPAVQVTKTSSTVLVASKFQNALEFVIDDNSGREVTVTINGNAENLRGKVKGILPFGAKAVGFTRVDADAWQKILTKYQKNRLLASGVVFAVSSEDEAEAYERSNIKTGLEPVDPQNTQTNPKN